MLEIMTIEETLTHIKTAIETAISQNGRAGAESLIRSGSVINYIHEYIKNEFIAAGINPDYVYPRLGRSAPEIRMTGALKKKDQDICIIPSDFKPEQITEGVMEGEIDGVGQDLMNRSISINIRSQMSSISKNFDTLYERTFAEPLNLHLRAPRLVTGDIYMIPVRAYDPDAMMDRLVAFREYLPKKYIPAFQLLNNLASPDVDFYKYERVCLLIADFRPDRPVVLHSPDLLLEEELIA